MKKVCRHCSSEFPPNTRNTKEYCSESCKDFRMKENRICKNCKKSFSVKKYIVRRGQGRFCGTPCSIQNQTGKPRGNYAKEEAINQPQCHKCHEYKPIAETEHVVIGPFKLRICKSCLVKPYRPDERPKKKKEIKIIPKIKIATKTKAKAKIKMPKDVYDESLDARRWEEAEKFMNKT